MSHSVAQRTALGSRVNGFSSEGHLQFCLTLKTLLFQQVFHEAEDHL